MMSCTCRRRCLWWVVARTAESLIVKVSHRWTGRPLPWWACGEGNDRGDSDPVRALEISYDGRDFSGRCPSPTGARQPAG